MKIKLITLIIACSTITKLNAQHGTSPEWKTPVQLPKANTTADANGAVSNNMIVKDDGTVWIFYKEEGAGIGSKDYLTGSNDNGVSWNNPAPEQFTPSLKTINPTPISADMDVNGNVHTLWSADAPEAVFYARWNGTDWSDTIRIASKTRFNLGYNQITTDRKGRIHAYWNDGKHESAETAEVMYSRSLDGGDTWSTPQMLSTDDGFHSAFPSGDFSGATDDTLAIAWRDSVGPGGSGAQDWDIQMVVSTDGGASWSTPFTAASGDGMQSDPAIIVDKNNLIHMSFHEYPLPGGTNGARVWYGYSGSLGATWNTGSFIQVSPQDTMSHLLKAAYDFTNDIVWYFYKDQRDKVLQNNQADLMAYYIKDGGTRISESEFLTDADTNDVAYHNFKVGADGIPRAHYKIGNLSPVNIYYTQRTVPVGIIETTKDANFIYIYPNPADNSITLSAVKDGNTEINILDVVGKEVLTTRAGEGIDISSLAPGVYFVVIKSGKFTRTEKVIKN